MPQRETSQREHPDGNGNGEVRIDPSMSRLDRMEAAIESIHRTLEVQLQRMADMQAEVDLLKAKRRRSA